MPDLLVRDKPGPLVAESDELAARAELRRQIGRLELQLARLRSEAFPRLELETRVAAPAASPRALGLGDLERVRDDLAVRISEARGALSSKGEAEAANKELLEAMLADPAEHK